MLKLELIWTLADLINTLMALPNLIALLPSPLVFKISRDYFAKWRAQKSPRRRGLK